MTRSNNGMIHIICALALYIFMIVQAIFLIGTLLQHNLSKDHEFIIALLMTYLIFTLAERIMDKIAQLGKFF